MKRIWLYRMEDGERELVNLMSSHLSGKMKSKKEAAPRVLVGGVKQLHMKEKEDNGALPVAHHLS
jgi:hypothetical protein